MKIGVVGATGLIGQTLVDVLEEQSFPIRELSLFATKKSIGTKISFHNQPIQVSELTVDSLQDDFDYLFFTAGSDCSKKFIPHIHHDKTIVIDNSPAFRMFTAVPLVIPEINKETLAGDTKIISNPNCAAIQLLKAIYPIYSTYGIEKLVVTTFQSVSGAGMKGLWELEQKEDEFPIQSIFQKPIFGNVIPVIGQINSDGFSDEERKIILESRKILKEPALPIFPTTVRIPVRFGHCESVLVQTKRDFELMDAVCMFKNQSFLKIASDTFTPSEAKGSDDVFVSRIRKLDSRNLLLWITADNTRVGAATNAVNIMLAHRSVNSR